MKLAALTALRTAVPAGWRLPGRMIDSADFSSGIAAYDMQSVLTCELGRTCRNCATAVLEELSPLMIDGVRADNQQSAMYVERRSSSSKVRWEIGRDADVSRMRSRTWAQSTHGDMAMPASISLRRKRLMDKGRQKKGRGTASADDVKCTAGTKRKLIRRSGTR
jgi:hypothetical protein